jgi:hypothetical protein
VFQYAPQMLHESDELRFLLDFTQTWTAILLHMSQACIIFVFNSTAKEELRKLLCMNANPIPYGTTSVQNIIVQQYRS